MFVNQLLIVLLASIFPCQPADGVYYRSPAVQELNLTPVSGQFSILDDEGTRVEITGMSDALGIIYWYRRLKTPVCLTGECKLVDVGLYWDCAGDFLGLDVYGEHLTKTDHSSFSDADYEKLLAILHNDWSILREYDFEDLTTDPLERGGEGRADAASGATRTEIASEAVEHAVYTTYTLWHLVHNGEKEQLTELTIEQLKAGSLIDPILAMGTDKYKLFLLDLFAQARIDHGGKLMPLIMRGLDAHSDPHLQNVAIRSLSRLEINNADVQTDIAEAYEAAPADLRLRILSALQSVTNISDGLYAALERDVDIDNEWFAVKVLELLKQASAHSPEVIDAAKRLSKSKNTYARQTAEAFLQTVKE